MQVFELESQRVRLENDVSSAIAARTVLDRDLAKVAMPLREDVLRVVVLLTPLFD